MCSKNEMRSEGNKNCGATDCKAIALGRGRARDIGTLEPGKRADLIVFKGNLSAARKALKTLQWTMKAGVAYDSPRILAVMKGKVGLY
jgi:hypothetical protein